jgi:hypothetical protein
MYSGLRLPQIGKRRSDSSDACAVVVTYEDKATRDRAMLLCDQLVQNLWEDIDLEFSWCKFDYLRDPRIATAATAAASRADLIIFSAHASSSLPPEVRNWIEAWTNQRQDREGALVALIEAASHPINGATPTHLYLRDVADRARMDYLSDLPEAVSVEFTRPFDAIMHRAVTVTPVMERILHQISPYSHWGINE